MDRNSSSKLMPQCQHILKTEHDHKVEKYDNVCVPQATNSGGTTARRHTRNKTVPTSPGYQLRTHSPPCSAKSSNRVTDQRQLEKDRTRNTGPSIEIPHLMRFLDVILGALMAAPMRLLPVMKMPLEMRSGSKQQGQ